MLTNLACYLKKKKKKTSHLSGRKTQSTADLLLSFFILVSCLPLAVAHFSSIMAQSVTCGWMARRHMALCHHSPSFPSAAASAAAGSVCCLGFSARRYLMGGWVQLCVLLECLPLNQRPSSVHSRERWGGRSRPEMCTAVASISLVQEMGHGL